MTEEAPIRVERHPLLGGLGLSAGGVVLVLAGIGLVLAAQEEAGPSQVRLLGFLLLVFLGGLGLAAGSAIPFGEHAPSPLLRPLTRR